MASTPGVDPVKSVIPEFRFRAIARPPNTSTSSTSQGETADNSAPKSSSKIMIEAGLKQVFF